MRRTFVFVAFLFGFAGVAGVAHAEVVQYMSRHPIPKRIGHGFCDIDVPHFHDYPPSDPRLYRQVDGQYYFVGDPTPFGYDGPRYSFYGPHPIADASVQLGGPSYCYLQGPHSHWYAPPPQAHFEMRGGAYWYVGAFDPVFYADQPRFVVVNDVYAPLVYERPVIDVAIAPPDLPRRVPRRWRAGVALRAGLARESRVARAGTRPWVARAGTGPGWRGPGPGPGWRGPERREMVMRERHEEFRRDEHREWERGHDRGWHGGPAGTRTGWSARRLARRSLRDTQPGGPHGGWHPGPAPAAHAGPPANGGGWHGGGGGPHPGGGHGNQFHR